MQCRQVGPSRTAGFAFLLVAQPQPDPASLAAQAGSSSTLSGPGFGNKWVCLTGDRELDLVLLLVSL